VRPNLYLGPRIAYAHSEIIEREADGLLAGDTVPGHQGGNLVGVGAVANWDSRDDHFFPLNGNLWELSSTWYGSALGSDYYYWAMNLDLRHYWQVGEDQVVAFRGLTHLIDGSPPFQRYSLLGGMESMRGYYEGRYRDKHLIVFQTEYRRPLWRRLGVVFFGGVGDVADEIGRFTTGDLKLSLGWGLRFQMTPDEKINLRLDIGYGKDSSGMYITMNEAF